MECNPLIPSQELRRQSVSPYSENDWIVSLIRFDLDRGKPYGPLIVSRMPWIVS